MEDTILSNPKKEELNSCFLKAKNGDRFEQIRIKNFLSKDCRIITYSYYYTGKKLGMNLSDFDELFYLSLGTLFLKYDENLGDLVVYFRYIYNTKIKDEIRRKKKLCSKILYAPNTNFDENLDNNEYNISTKNFKYENELLKMHSYEITKLILENRKLLNKEEKKILNYFLDGLSTIEISNELNQNYHTVDYKFKNLKNKIRRFIKSQNVYKEL